MKFVLVSLAASPLLALPAPTPAQESCEPTWTPTLGGIPGVAGLVRALAAFDDGSGAALYVAGVFGVAGGELADNVAKWDGASWSALGGGVNNEVRALVVYDDGSGPALYAGGAFTTAGGLPASKIAKWDGESWSSVGGGVNGDVRALVVHDDGSGPALYAGGSFTTAGGAPANRTAKWDGASWSDLGGGPNGAVLALATYDDGSGPALYAAGTLSSAGGGPANRVAKWDGSTWSPLGSGIGGQIPIVRTLAAYDDGTGPALYAGGEFTTAGGSPANRIAKWDGASWSEVGGGLDDEVFALVVHDDGSGSALFVGGEFDVAGSTPADGIARWDGASWSPVGSGVAGVDGGRIAALGAFDAGDGAALYAGGSFDAAGGIGAMRVAQWQDSSWSALGPGMNESVLAFAEFDDGTGPALYVGGEFQVAEGVAVSAIAKWDGSSWSQLGTGIDDRVRALAAYDDGSGPALFVGGQFTIAGGIPARHIAKWDGSSWSALGTVTYNSGSEGIYAFAVHDDGSGPALYAAGSFHTIGGVPASHIARWDGSTWSALGSGLAGNGGRALMSYDDGSGAGLYVGGEFSSAGGAVNTRGLARWDGASWSSVGGGTDRVVLSLAVYDDGSGHALHAGGTFTAVGGMPANGIAKWNGTSWDALGSGLAGAFVPYSSADALQVFDDGSGPALYAAGAFTSAGGVEANGIARWDGSSWFPIGDGVVGIRALFAHDDGGGPALFAGGDFVRAPDSGDSFLTRLVGCPDSLAPTLSVPSAVTVVDRLDTAPGEVVHFVVTASDNMDPSPSVESVPPSGSFFPRGTTLVTCTATDAEGNQSVAEFPVIVQPKWSKRRL